MNNSNLFPGNQCKYVLTAGYCFHLPALKSPYITDVENPLEQCRTFLECQDFVLLYKVTVFSFAMPKKFSAIRIANFPVSGNVRNP